VKGFFYAVRRFLYRANLRSILRRVSSHDISLTSQRDFEILMDSALEICRAIDPQYIIEKEDFLKSQYEFEAVASSIDSVINHLNDFRHLMRKGDAVNTDRYRETQHTDLIKFFVSHKGAYLDVPVQWTALQKAIFQFIEEYQKLSDKALESYYHRQGLRLVDHLCQTLTRIAYFLV